MKSIRYTVIFEPFSEKHFIKSFAKKYKGAWDFTLKFLYREFEQIDLLFLKNTAETIVDSAKTKICKTEFRVAQTKEPRKSSGNRCIVAVEKETSIVHVLLVYNKTDLGGSQETTAWKNIIRNNYPQYRDIL